MPETKETGVVHSVDTTKLQDCHFRLLNQVIETVLLHIGIVLLKFLSK